MSQLRLFSHEIFLLVKLFIRLPLQWRLADRTAVVVSYFQSLKTDVASRLKEHRGRPTGPAVMSTSHICLFVCRRLASALPSLLLLFSVDETSGFDSREDALVVSVDSLREIT